MSYSNFGRGRGYPQGTRAARRFGRPRFPRPPFRHAAPLPRPGHPAQFGVPWQPNNMFFQPHTPLRGSPPFRADGRRRRFCNYDIRFPAPNRLPVPPSFEETPVLPEEPILQETDTIETVPQLPLLGSEEERQQKIIETADRLKQKLSSFNTDDIPDIWNEDIPSNVIEDNTEDNAQRRIPVVGYKSSEINLTYNDLKDIGKINPDNTQCIANEFDITNNIDIINNTDNDVMILDENKDENHLMISNDQMTNLENVPDDNQYMEVDKEWIENGQGVDWELQEPVDNSQNLEQPDLHTDNIIENELLESDFQYHDTPLINISQEQDDQQQDISQGIEIYPTDVTKEPDEPETLNLQADVSFPIDSTDQDILQDVSQEKEELFENLQVQESALNSHVYAENSNSSNCTLTQTPLIDIPVSNVTLDNQLPRMKENSFQSGPPKLSPHTEQELPVDFDPTTPPPILLKQDQSCILPPYSIPDLPLFDPTEPPPNIKCLLGTKMPHEDANPPWSNAQIPIPAVYNNMEVHTGLNTHGGFMPQQLPLEIVNQSNVFMPSHIDSVNFSPMFPMLPSNPVVNTHVPSLPQVHAAPLNTCVSSSSLPELSSSSDLHCSINKDDGLNDMQEAMRFAKEMTSITGKTDEESKSSSKNYKSLSKSSTSIDPASDVESIALPPGKPKTKINKQKKVKESDTSSKKKISEEQNAADYPSSEETTQDANVKSKDAAALMNELERPKVVFNLNNKAKVVSTKSSWKENNEKKNGMTHSIEPEKTSATKISSIEPEKPSAAKTPSIESEKTSSIEPEKSPVAKAPSIIKKNLENTLLKHKKEEKNLKKKENNSENAISSEIANQNIILHHKKPQKDVHTEKSQHSNVSFPKVNVPNSRSRVEKNENSKMDASWKNRIISRFLKMSKNDIYNMVNNTSLRKFDIIMKRLVKEKKPTLSLEMRHAQDEKMKLYDQQEFMKQLNAMLDTDAIVSITDLPTEFIHHLNEVLQLDVQPDIQAESAAASSSQYGHLEDTNRTFNPVITQIPECTNKTTMLNDVSQECVKSKGHAVKTGSNKNVPAHSTINNDLNLKDDTCNPIVTNVPNVNNSLLTLQHDLDDIFSEVTKKIQTPAAVKERKRCSMGQQSAKKFNVGAISRSMEKEAFMEDDRTHRLENSPHWDEKCDRWKRKEREDPHAYRNLTKEEWEARYGMQTDLTVCIPSNSIDSPKRIVVTKRGRGLLSRGRGRKVYPRRRYSSESSKQQLNTRHRSLEKEKHKKSRRHSDDRKHTTEYLEYDINQDSDSSSSSTSSSSSSNSSDNTNVTKLLRAIKENEKVAKQMSLNEAIRDEVNAEIERERKSRKSRKTYRSSKSRKQRKARYKKKKRQNKEMTSSSDSSSEKDNDNNETTDKLLTEKEIKKEVIENQVVQEVIVKEELDISQEENTRDAEFINASNHLMTMENKTAHFFSTSQNRVESPLAQEIPLTSINTTQLHAEERLPIGSPTQLKTKAQLKQMPETSDMNDNKVPLNAFTCIPENWNASNPASFSECTEDLNKTCETADASCSQDKTVLSTNDSVIEQSSIAHVSACSSEINENTILQQSDVTACILTESSIKIQDSKSVAKISDTDNDTSKASTAATSASLVSSVPSASTASPKQGGSKKINIKTYYERTVQRRMNEKLESKKPAENPTTSTQNLITPKSIEPEIAVNKFTLTSTSSSSIQDPRLAPKRTEENSNRTVNNDNVVQKSNQIKSKDKEKSLAPSSVNVLPNVVTTSKIVASKAKKCSEVKNTATDKTLQSKVASDPKRFKNIRSEGSKELKLKKEMAKEQKAKKKSTTPSKSDNLISTKIYFPLEKTTSTEEKEKKINNINDTNKIIIKGIQSISSQNKVNTSNVKTSISSGNTDNDGNELSHNIIKKERSLNEVRERGNDEKGTSNVESTDTREHSSKTTRDETHSIKRAKNTTSVKIADKKGHKKIRNITPEPDTSTASKIALKVPESKISNSIEKINKDISTEIQQSDTIKNIKLSLNNTDESQIKQLDRDLTESTINRDGSISELDAVSRVDSIDKQSKKNLLVNIETSSTKENDMKLNILDATNKSVSANKGNSPGKKTAESSSTSNENSQERQSTENNAISSDSVGSPFKGFLQETMMDFEQPNLFDVNYVTTSANCKDMKIEERQDYETLEPGTDYTNDTNINANENFNIAFSDNLLSSDKECVTNEKSDKSDLTTDENREGHVRKSSSEIVTTILHSEVNDINIGRGNETDRQLTISKEGYTCCAGLVIKESMLLDNEEEIQSEVRSKDLISKLKTTIDPSLSDALEATISDDALRLPDCQRDCAEHLDNNIYLETNITAEKASCDKLPGFDSDEHLDNDIFYLDDRLQSAATFDTKDDECVHFSVDQQQSPEFDIMPAVIPEATIVTSCADLSRSEISKSEGKFDMKHISSTENNLLAGPSPMECSPTGSPRTLNVPTKAALKEAANLFLKSLSNLPTATKEVTLEILDKTQQNGTDINYQTPTWRVEEQNNRKPSTPEIDNNTTATQNAHNNMTAQVSLNVNKIPHNGTRGGESVESVRKDVGVNANHDKSIVSPTNVEKRLHSNIQREPVVELLKMRELDKLLEKRSQENSEKIKEKVHEEKRNQETSARMREKDYEDRKKRNDSVLYRLKDKRQMKYRSKETLRKNSLVKRLKKMKRSGKIVGNTKEAVLARMLEIDLEIHKLVTEKLKLHELLRSNVPSSEKTMINDSVVLRTAENNTVPDQSEIPSTSQNSEINHAKQDRHVSPSKSSKLIKGRKRTLSSHDNENTSYTPRSKTPVIRWKKKPRLEQTVRQEKEGKYEEEENLNKVTKEQISTFVSKKIEKDIIDTSENFQKSNAVKNNKARKDKTARKKTDKEADISSKRSIDSDKSTTDKSADERSECRDFTEGETERAKHFDTDKSNDISPPNEVAKVNSQPSNKHMHSTPESLSIYTDDSTWDSLVQNTASEIHKKASGLALLNETLKKELAMSQKMKSIVQKKKKEQLDNILRTVNNLTGEEEDLPLDQLYIKKLQQKRDLLDTLSQRKENLVESDILKNINETINTVAENKEENLFEPQSEARASDDIPPTSNVSPILQSDKHQILVDAEANANSDWPCREKENTEEVALQQDSNDVPDGSNHVFKAVSQDKVLFYSERNVEPDSSITPEETQAESHSSDCERDRVKNSNDVASRNFDIKVSVLKTLIKDDFSLGLLQKNKDTEVVGTDFVDSTTNAFLAQTERLEEKDKNYTTNAFSAHTDRLEENDKDSTTNAFSAHTKRLEAKDKDSTTNAFSPHIEKLEEKNENLQSTSQADNSIVEKHKKDEKDEAKDKRIVNANEKEETIDSASNTPVPQLVNANSDVTENERSNNSVESNDKISIIDAERDSNVLEKTDTKRKKPDIESDFSNYTIAVTQDCQNIENTTKAAKEEEKNNPENKSGIFEKILNNDQGSGSSVPVDLMNERSEDEVFVEQISGLEHTSTSIFSPNKAKGKDMSKKFRCKHDTSTPIRRSTRNSNENKSSKMNETDTNSSSSGPSSRETSVFHENDLTVRSRSKSPTWTKRDERVVNNIRKNRVSHKVQNTRKVSTESETKIENQASHLDTIIESAILKNRTKKRKQRTDWQMKHCKVRLIDCKSILYKYINPKVLGRLGIIIINPSAPNDSSCMQHITCNHKAAIIPTAASSKSFFDPTKSCDKEKSEIQILEEKSTTESSEKDLVQEPVSHTVESNEDESARMQYTVHKGPILDLKIFENSFLAASEDGKIYRYSQKFNGILNIYKGHKSAVTCLYIYKSDDAGVEKNLMYSGSLDGTLRCYKIMTGALVGNPAQTKSPIQCMDQAWGMIFIGTKSGHVSRFYIEASAIKEDSIPFSEKSVLALKATNEGPRRILIIASRNQPINIRDALTGLLLRMISGQNNSTVYSLLRHDNLIYCGTSSTSINVFDFTMGEQVTQYEAGVGIVCMRLYKQLLFAGCYDGNIYVFDINNHKLIHSIRGPGNMLLSVEVVNNKIIAGSKDKRLHMWQMPTQVRALL
ncbi:ZN106 protein, partial [Pseudoatta argentina]